MTQEKEKKFTKQFISILEKLYQDYQKKFYREKIGVFVSGGIDSSIIAYFTNKYFEKITLFTLHSKKATDLDFVKILNDKLGRQLVIVNFDKTDVEKIKNQVLAILKKNKLKCDLTQISLACAFYLLCQKAAQMNIKIIFTGQGPDILLAGYHFYQQINWENLNEKIKKDIPLLTIDKKRDKAMANFFNVRLINPYLEKEFINFSLTVPAPLKINKIDGEIFEKYLSRQVGRYLKLPQAIVFRHKKALQYSTKIQKSI